MPVPDTVLNQARLDNQTSTYIESSGMTSVLNGGDPTGFASPMMNSGMLSTNLTELG